MPSAPPGRQASIAAPLSVRVAGSSLVLSGAVAGRLGREPALSDFLHRCLRLDGLEGVRFDLAEARIELLFSRPIAALGDGLRGLARILRDGAPRDNLRSTAFIRDVSQRVWEEPVTLWRSGQLLSTWRLYPIGGNRVRLRHAILRDPTAHAIITSFLRRRGAATLVDGRSGRSGFVDLQCNPHDPHCLLRLLSEAESIEAVLRRRAVIPLANPEGGALLINANLALALGASAFPALMPVSAAILAVASWPAARQAWRQLRQRRVDVTVVLTILSALALVNGDHIPAALMLWLFRIWDLLTRRSLRRAEVGVFERLAAASNGDWAALRGAAEAAVTIFAQAPRSRAATAFADASTPLMLCVGASALFSGGAPLAQAVLRPDFFSPVLVHRRIAAAEIALHLAQRGIVVRDFRALLEIRHADEILLDDGVEWETSGLAPGEFGRRMAELGLSETVLFRPNRDDRPDDLPVRIGATRHFVRSAAHTPASYLAQQRFLGHRIIYVHAMHGADPHARADVPIAIGPSFLIYPGAPVGQSNPNLAQLCEILELVRKTQGEETAIKSITIALNAVVIGACVYAGLSALGVVTVGALATGSLWIGLEGRFRSLAAQSTEGAA
ncbi:hypothetical protein [Methylobacterium radiotolerans]|uniref:Uncharacterized protein n=1 Tax=Methylobacterium radiotolerans (strain ATCC 27329 / DSM 1819 / JCM 2831 / NBRC 15690 / NCIMB 10815 / 0-1) TaxID=426355 RepID=B1MA61_METRJ|nr:hypothetical protein [Methylobacterium radiotolerans]ACB28386.1 hypothetical protein Mrad2831_6472 [Methylobacterium radiotolerans JCM 2831]GEN01753.1 hypothetical protein MRA01_62920 [Methylobacterium radiotolerans]